MPKAQDSELIPVRKPRKLTPYSYAQKPGPKPKADAPKTSAKKATKTRDNLTLRDWMTVFAFMDSHPDMAQTAIVDHFKSKSANALVFTQSTLSRKLKEREKLEERVESNPNALSSKRPRVVTRPDVERALILWVQSMELKKETINGPMLTEKRKRFEEEFNVPDEQRLTGVGWVSSFCKTYGLKEYRRHGEAGSVDHEAVIAEQIRVREILAPFAKKDRWNFDESALFAFAPPDRGLATQQTSGKKISKFRITLGFACNADGSEKADILFIGKWKQPRCFGKLSPNARGFDYHHNKAAWMTSEIFEKWIRKFDMKMRQEDRHVCLLIDNFQGHNIAYSPTNVQVEFFQPNLTSFVQPLDAGVIRCFKAHYRRSYCQRALDLDEVGERDIYKLNLLEAMSMARDAWNSVSSTTIEHCWNHTGIQRAPIGRITLHVPAKSRSHAPDSPIAAAWNVLEELATTDMTLPQAEDRLQSVLGDGYVDEEWRPALCAVMAAENDVEAALNSISNLRLTADLDRTIPISDEPPAQSHNVEEDLLKCVARLKERNRIFGPASTLEELVNPVEEQEIGEDSRKFESDEDIVDAVRREEAITRGEIIEVDSDDEDDPGHQVDDDADIGVTEMMALCQRLEKASLKGGTSNALSYNVSQVLRRFRVELSRVQIQNAKQVTLTSLWGTKA